MGRHLKGEVRKINCALLKKRRLKVFGAIRGAERETGIPRSVISRWENGVMVPGPAMRQRILELWKFKKEADFYNAKGEKKA